MANENSPWNTFPLGKLKLAIVPFTLAYASYSVAGSRQHDVISKKKKEIIVFIS